MADKSENNNPFANATVICAYTRAQAIDDGVLVDVSETAREAGIKFPTVVTEAVWKRYVEFDAKSVGQDERGRLWDILWMLRFAIGTSRGQSEILFKLHVAMSADCSGWWENEKNPERGSHLKSDTHRLVTLKAICGPGDTAEPVITISLPDED